MSKPPLDGIRVLDLSRVLAGPWCTQTLADLGAEIWKVEAPGRGDDTRGWMPPDLDGESTYFLCCNRSKLSVEIDFKSEAGRETVRALARQADVLVENFRLGALDAYGLGYDRLHEINPRLIYCSISGYGRTGSRAGEAGYDFTIQAESGMMSITGEPDGSPMKVGVAITDIVTGMNATQSILAALIARERDGEGQHIDIALFDTAVSVMANIASGYLATGRDTSRYGNAHPTVVPYQLFDTADGTLVLAVGSDSQFRSLCLKVIDRPDLAEDERFVRNRSRAANRDVLVPLLANIFRRRRTDEWIEALRAAGVPGGKVRKVSEVFASPEVGERGLVCEVPDKIHGTLRLVRSPIRFSRSALREMTAPPRLGEHTEILLAQAAKG
jgi:crotonobetainyl-CoA:carnitine CoA-transferase CaiB-like acyl-CoA transferase